MTYERRRDLELYWTQQLTGKEIDEGWHWCCEWDGLLVGPGMEELEVCRCGTDEVPWIRVKEVPLR